MPKGLSFSKRGNMLARRQFGAGALASLSTAVSGLQATDAETLSFTTPLPIPELLDAEKSGNALSLTAAFSRHEFVKGKPTAALGYSAPILGPTLRLRRGSAVNVTIHVAHR